MSRSAMTDERVVVRPASLAIVAAMLGALAPVAFAARPPIQPFQGIPTAAGVVTARCSVKGQGIGSFDYAVNGSSIVSRGICKPGAITALRRTGAAQDVALFNGTGFSDAYFEEQTPSGPPGGVAIRFRIAGPPVILDYGEIGAPQEVVYVTDDIAELRFSEAGKSGPWLCALQFDWSEARVVSIAAASGAPKAAAADCATRFKKLAIRYDH